jgi:hypothetical protein
LLYLIFNLSGTQLTKEEKYLKVKFPYDTLVQGIDMSTKKMVFWCIFLVFLLGTLEKEQFICFAHSSDSNVMSTDLNGDGVVDMRDIAIIAKAYDSYLGGANWNREADLNNDGVINILDFVLIAKDFGMKMFCDNSAAIPTDWGNYASDPAKWEAYGSGNQIIFLDFNVVRTPDKPSIHFALPHTSEDMNEGRECNGRWLPVNPGDHVVFTCWMKTTLSQYSTYNNDLTDSYGKGARIGIDFYHDNTNLLIGALVNGLGSDTVTIPGYPQLRSAGSHVPWNTPNWTKQTIDFIVPSGYNINKVVAWMQVVESEDSGQAWFADAELYINPP